MRTVILLFVSLICLHAGAQQVINPYSNVSSFVPSNANTDIRLLAMGYTWYDTVRVSLYDSNSYHYTAGRGWNSTFGYWQYDWSENIRPVRNQRSIHTYNSNGELITVEKQAQDASGNWYGSIREKYTYLNNKLVALLLWDGYTYTEQAYGYNSNGQIIEEARKKSTNANGPWKDTEMYTYSYGPDGPVNQVHLATNAQGTWLITDSIHFSYANGKLTEMVRMQRLPNRWINSSLETYLYNSNGQLEKDLTLFWNTTLSNWDTTRSHTYMYDNNSRDTLITIEDPKTGWRERKSYTYDAAGYISKIDSRLWSPASTAWKNSYQARFHYGKFNLNISNKQDYAKKLSLYPVPASQYLNIDIAMPVKQELQLAIYQADGRMIRSWNQPAISTEYKEQIDLSSIPAGNYILQVNSADGKITKQFSVIR